MRSPNPILLVEDDAVDALTIKKAFKEIKLTNELVHVRNGEEAMKYLISGDQEMPCMILLDINMPKMNGIEFLEVRKKHKQLTTIPVVVLTTSVDEQDKSSSFQLGVCGYMVKPIDYLQFVEVIRIINQYWTVSEMVIPS